MIMTFEDLRKEIHENAVRHGFWDDGTMEDIAHVCNLINTEWAEAIQSNRETPILHYFEIGPQCDEQGCPDEPDGPMLCQEPVCFLGKKPEGTAVELIDGVIRIFDLAEGRGWDNFSFDWRGIDQEERQLYIEEFTLDALCSLLFAETGAAGVAETESEQELHLYACVTHVLTWLMFQGVDPMVLIREKMDFNAKRERLHGRRY